MIPQQKKLLRKQIKEKKTQQSASTLKRWSEEILSTLEQRAVFQEAKTVLLYYSLSDEVDTHSFIERWSKSKKILLPVVEGDRLSLCEYTGPDFLADGAFGIKEPIGNPFTDLDSIDLAIIPGVAFDVYGNRLGRGKGYYDKLLPFLKAYTIGVCFPFQLLRDELPCDENDVGVGEVVGVLI